MFARFVIPFDSSRVEILGRINRNPVFQEKLHIDGVFNARYEWVNTGDFDHLRLKGRKMMHTGSWELRASLVETSPNNCRLNATLVLGPVQRLIFALVIGTLLYFLFKNGIRLAGTEMLIRALTINVLLIAFFFFLPMGLLHLWKIKIRRRLHEMLSNEH